MTTKITAFTSRIPAHTVALGDIIFGHTEVGPQIMVNDRPQGATSEMFSFEVVTSIEAITHEDVQINGTITVSRSNFVQVVRASDHSQSANIFRAIFAPHEDEWENDVIFDAEVAPDHPFSYENSKLRDLLTTPTIFDDCVDENSPEDDDAQLDLHPEGAVARFFDPNAEPTTDEDDHPVFPNRVVSSYRGRGPKPAGWDEEAAHTPEDD